MIFRKATMNDIPAIVDIACESVTQEGMPQLTIDRASMADTAKACLAPMHFMWVAEQDGKVVAAFAAVVQKSFWFTRMSCSVLLYYTRVKGAGLPLLREFAKWVKSRPAIKTAVIEFEPTVDPRLVQFFKKVGFTRESLNLSYIRSAS